MSVFFTIVGDDEITMVADSQGTRPADGMVVHDAPKIQPFGSRAIVALGGDGLFGEILVRTARETIEEMYGNTYVPISTCVDILKETALQYLSLRPNMESHARSLLLQVAGVSHDGTFQLAGLLVTPEQIAQGKIDVDPNFPVYIAPPPDVDYPTCERVLRSKARQKFPCTDQLTAQQWTQIANLAVEDISRLSRYVDSKPQQIALYRKRCGHIAIRKDATDDTQ